MFSFDRWWKLDVVVVDVMVLLVPEINNRDVALLFMSLLVFPALVTAETSCG